MKSKITLGKPVLLILYGIPGSGKSTFAHQFTNLVDSVHLKGQYVFPEEFQGKERTIQNRLLKYMTQKFLHDGLSVVYDGETYKTEDRVLLTELARMKGLTSLVVWLQIDPDTAFFRKQRQNVDKTAKKIGKSYTENSFEQALLLHQNPKNKRYVVISGKHTFNTQFSAVISKLSEIGAISSYEEQSLFGGKKSIVKPGLVNNVPMKPASHTEAGDRRIMVR